MRFLGYLCWTFLVASSTVSAREVATTINIPAGTLVSVIGSLAGQTDSDIGIADNAIARLAAPRISGRYNTGQALDLLARALPIRIKRIGPRGWLVVASRRVMEVRTVPSGIARPFAVAKPLPPEEIVVVASKRELELESLPATVQVIEGSNFGAGADLSNAEALSKRAALLTTTHFGTGRDKIFVRGIADSSFNGPLQTTIGQYLGDFRLTYATPDPDLRLYDLRRVEVLAGPQGTLYGAGAMGGVIRMEPEPPRFDQLEVEVGAGLSQSAGAGFGQSSYAVANVPLVRDSAAIRAVGYSDWQPGYITRMPAQALRSNAESVVGGRLSLLIAPPAASWRIEATGVLQNISGADARYTEQEGGFVNRFVRFAPMAQPHTSNYALGGLRFERSMGHLVAVADVSHARSRTREHYALSRVSAAAGHVEVANATNMTTGEIRFLWRNDDWSGIGGANITAVDVSNNRFVGNVDRGPGSIFNQRRDLNLFGEMSTPEFHSMRLTVGGRILRSRLVSEVHPAGYTIQQEGSGKISETLVAPSVAFLVKPTNTVTLFGRYQEGFRPSEISIMAGKAAPLRSERLSSKEIGIRIHGKSLTMSASAAFSNWNNVQADLLDTKDWTTVVGIGNGLLRSFCMDLFLVPKPSWEFRVSVVANHSRMIGIPSTTLSPQPDGSYDVIYLPGSVSKIPNVAGTALISARYTAASIALHRLSFEAQANYVGRSAPGVGQVLSRSVGGYVTMRGGVTLTKGQTSWSLNINNLTGSGQSLFSVGNPFVLNAKSQDVPMRPRTISISLSQKFSRLPR